MREESHKLSWLQEDEHKCQQEWMQAGVKTQ